MIFYLQIVARQVERFLAVQTSADLASIYLKPVVVVNHEFFIWETFNNYMSGKRFLNHIFTYWIVKRLDLLILIVGFIIGSLPNQISADSEIGQEIDFFLTGAPLQFEERRLFL